MDKSFKMSKGRPPKFEDLCDMVFCNNASRILDAITGLIEEWPQKLGCCILCSHFQRPDFEGSI